MENEIVIRSLTTLSEIEPIEKLQKEVWGYGATLDAPFPYPSRCLFEFAESGGLVAGAYLGGERLIAFAAAWIGRDRLTGQLYLHSQLVGVQQEFRDRGIGFRLKLYQREYALASGLALIKWTFDPLQVRNAYLNLHKLGAEVRRFVPDYFGPLGGKMNLGLATDRFWAEWQITTPLRSEQPESEIIDRSRLKSVNRLDGPKEARRIVEVDTGLDDERLLVELPNNIQQLRQTQPQLVSDWQLKLRTVFKSYLPRYTIVDILRESDSSFYLLEQGPFTA
ncbi:MAG TPA: GNAT family N-acetyltransferase [Pyrinomonadaceae bacterium]|jgi:predicted GNAT superfamily acetyltransferase